MRKKKENQIKIDPNFINNEWCCKLWLALWTMDIPCREIFFPSLVLSNIHMNHDHTEFSFPFVIIFFSFHSDFSVKVYPIDVKLLSLPYGTLSLLLYKKINFVAFQFLYFFSCYVCVWFFTLEWCEEFRVKASQCWTERRESKNWYDLLSCFVRLSMIEFLCPFFYWFRYDGSHTWTIVRKWNVKRKSLDNKINFCLKTLILLLNVPNK